MHTSREESLLKFNFPNTELHSPSPSLGFSNVVFNSKAINKLKSPIQPRKSSASHEEISTGGRHSRSDTNYNFVHEEIVPGKEKQEIVGTGK